MAMTKQHGMERGAILSDCGKYRYLLWRRWDKTKPRLIFIMLNPSTADAEVDDATIRVCMGRARRMDLGGIRVLNLFAYRATLPAELGIAADPVGPENDHYIARYLGMRDFDGQPEPMIAAWGDGGLRNGHRRARWREVLSIICGEMGDPLHHIGLTKAGQPKHPLRVSYGVSPVLWMNRELSATSPRNAPAVVHSAAWTRRSCGNGRGVAATRTSWRRTSWGYRYRAIAVRKAAGRE
jgi:hypothetical protein